MDRPRTSKANPVIDKVYCALTNNSHRGTTFEPDEANPITTSMVRAELGQPLTRASGNRNGYVLEITENGDRPTAKEFRWKLRRSGRRELRMTGIGPDLPVWWS